MFIMNKMFEILIDLQPFIRNFFMFYGKKLIVKNLIIFKNFTFTINF
jgi:hypothetical protein